MKVSGRDSSGAGPAGRRGALPALAAFASFPRGAPGRGAGPELPWLSRGGCCAACGRCAPALAGAGGAASPSRHPRRRLLRSVPEVSPSPLRGSARPDLPARPQLPGEAAARRGKAWLPASPVTGAGARRAPFLPHSPPGRAAAASLYGVLGSPGRGGRCSRYGSRSRLPAPRWLLVAPAGPEPREETSGTRSPAL